MFLIYGLVFLLWSSCICAEDESDYDGDEQSLFNLLNTSNTQDILIENIDANQPARNQLRAKTISAFPTSSGYLRKKPSIKKSSISCTVRRFENVYYFGLLASVKEDVGSEYACVYLCWKKANATSQPCSSVNYLRSKRRCEFMQGVFGVQNSGMTGYYAKRNSRSTYVIPVRCADDGNANISKPNPAPSSPVNEEAYSFRRGGCGQSLVKSRFDQASQRIVGGVEARPHSHPWIVSLQSSRSHTCGGTLVRVNNLDERSDIVITAAHCLQRPQSNLQVALGVHSLRRTESGSKKIRVKKYVNHPSYSSRTQQNDIAIIVLEEPVAFGSSIQPTCLPTQGQVVADGTSAFVVGWGDRREGGPSSNELMEVIVPTISSNQCTSNYVNSFPVYPREMLCAGVQGKDSCQGDSGGPLTIKASQGFVLQGVVSFGDGCARARKPGVYTRVSTYSSWISQQIKLLSSLKQSG